MKVCIKCKIDKEESDYGVYKRNNKTKSDLTCKACKKITKDAYHFKNKEKIKSHKQKWHQDNKQRVNKKSREYSKTYHAENKELLKEKGRKYYSENKEKEAKRKKKYYNNNKEKVYLMKQKWRAKPENRAKENLAKKLKRENNPNVRISDSISARIRQSIRDKNNKHVFDILGYSLQDLMTHLESQFRDGMSWDNYGPEWHIDHVIPISYFKFKSKKDDQFKKCWSLDNLQPLLASENLSKCNRFIG